MQEHDGRMGVYRKALNMVSKPKIIRP